MKWAETNPLFGHRMARSTPMPRSFSRRSTPAYSSTFGLASPHAFTAVLLPYYVRSGEQGMMHKADEYGLLMVLGRGGPARLATDEDVISRQKKRRHAQTSFHWNSRGRNLARPDLPLPAAEILLPE
jgi:hypothetical protein